MPRQYFLSNLDKSPDESLLLVVVNSVQHASNITLASSDAGCGLRKLIVASLTAITFVTTSCGGDINLPTNFGSIVDYPLQLSDVFRRPESISTPPFGDLCGSGLST